MINLEIMGELIDAKTEMEEKLGATATDGITHEESWERLERIVQETSEQMKETYRRMRETDCQMKQMSAEVWAQIKETGEQMKETDRKLEKMYGQFTTQWGRIVEEVAKPAALKLFMDIGIDIDHVFQEPRHRKRDEMEMEVDVILVNTTAVVAVEVKTTLKQKDVDYFLKQMENFKELFREFKDKTVYVAVAAIKFDGSSDLYAKKNGVFVLRANSESIFKLDDLPEEKRRKY